MRTALFLIAGFLLLASIFILARLFSENYPSATAWATAGFVLLWLVVTTANLWVGVARAGYSGGGRAADFAAAVRLAGRNGHRAEMESVVSPGPRNREVEADKAQLRSVARFGAGGQA